MALGHSNLLLAARDFIVIAVYCYADNLIEDLFLRRGQPRGVIVSLLVTRLERSIPQ